MTKKRLSLPAWLLLLGLTAWPGWSQEVPQIDIIEVATGIEEPIGIVNAGDASDRLFIVSKPGRIYILDPDRVLVPTPFLDISDRVESEGLEQGLLGVAFHPDFGQNGLFFVDYTNLDGDSVTAGFLVTADPNVADPASEMEVLFIDQPSGVHQGGQLKFGPDGFLYLSRGDGGPSGDPDMRGQDLNSLLGKILRIDVSQGLPYVVPPDNPFVGDPTARDEIWAYGLRNPWRFTFDRGTGDLFIGEVGQVTWEEINYEPAGGPGGVNYGWSVMEGPDCFEPPVGCDTSGKELPILSYNHLNPSGILNCAVIGGYVYRGEDFPLLDGFYIYGDTCSGRIWAAVQEGETWATQEMLQSAASLSSFGEDEGGEIYAALRTFGIIVKVVDTRPLCDIDLSQPVYTDGETITISQRRLVNMGSEAVAVNIKLAVFPPAGNPILIGEVGADGSFSIAAGSDMDFGPLPLRTVSPQLPDGTYEVTCRIADPDTLEELSVDSATFEIQ